MRIVLELEVDEDELSIDKEEWNKMTKSEKEFELSVAMNDYLNSIDDTTILLLECVTVT